VKGGATSAAARRSRRERGDWQTPRALADAVVALVAGRMSRAPRTIVEPSCGEGTFLLAAAARFPRARLVGYELDAAHARTARRALAAHPAARVERADFFRVAWERRFSALEGPLLVVGNPPWVTSAALGALASSNLPTKDNVAGLSGLDAVTGKSNFDVSEWMIVRLLEALDGRAATLAMLCKSAVARRIVEVVARRELGVSPAGLWRIDAQAEFGASVDAVLLVANTQKRTPRARTDVWPVHASLAAKEAEGELGVVDNTLVADAACFARTRHLVGRSEPEWRSGVKHDCARVMELARPEGAAGWVNGLGERVDVEDELVFPLLKSSDVAHGRSAPTRAMIVTQRRIGAPTAGLAREAPRAFRYLSRHRALLEGRKSSIYEGQPPFAIFGVGPYSFAPWKVAVSGLYKRATFTLVGPHEGRAVVLDDTCYFLSFDDEAGARRAVAALSSGPAREFLAARIFWDAKRPITKSILQTLDLGALERAEGEGLR
jgi:hypothetical protein